LFLRPEPPGRPCVSSIRFSQDARVKTRFQTRRDKAAVKDLGRELKGKPAAQPIPAEAPKEDAFILPESKIAHEAPPKDPNAPSGSLSSDEANR
jgi:hypothetical protein